jgi:hypothetical protein
MKAGNRRRIGRLVAVAGAIAAGLMVVVVAGFAIYDHVAPWVLWRAGLGFLVAVEAAYGATVLGILVGVPILAVALYRRRGDRTRRLRIARGLALGVSTALALGLAEGGAAALRWQEDQGTGPRQAGGKRPAAEVQGMPGSRVPRQIALPETFEDAPGDPTVDIVMLGESSAEGVPYNFWLSIGRIVAWQLERLIPSRPVRLEVLASSGETLDRQHQKLAGLTRRPDLLVVYCGHNEFSSRFSWQRTPRYYRDERPPTPWESLTAWAVKTSPLLGLVDAQAEKCRLAVPPPPEAGRSLVDVPVYTPAEYQAVLADFERRLDEIAAYARRIGALLVLVVPPANDSGFEPNRSYLPPETPYAERAAFEREFRAARQGEADDPEASLGRYRTLVARQPRFAEAHYRLARLLERAGQWDEAYRHDLTARDCDGLPMRCLVAFQDAYRKTAARHGGILIDSQSYFHTIGRHGLLDDHLFHDGLHPSLRGQIALAQAILQGLRTARAFGWPEQVPAPAIDPAECARHFGLGRSEWQRVCLWGIMFYQLTAPVHYDPTRRRAMQDRFGKAHDRIAAGAAPESVGLPNIGVPPAVPLVPNAAILKSPPAAIRTD